MQTQCRRVGADVLEQTKILYFQDLVVIITFLEGEGGKVLLHGGKDCMYGVPHFVAVLVLVLLNTIRTYFIIYFSLNFLYPHLHLSIL